MLQGVKSLSGSSACRWYIDEDLPDINSFRARLGEEIAPVVVYTSTNQGLHATRVREAPVELTVQQLLRLDPTHPSSVLSLSGGWALTNVGGFSHVESVVKLLMLMDLNSVAQTMLILLFAAEAVYYICTFANDGTTEAEFMFFEKVARAAIGKPLLTLLSQKYPGCSEIHEFAQMAGSDQAVPMEVSRMVTKKYRLVVTISHKSVAPTSHQLSFQVSRIEHTFKPELGPLGFGHGAGTPGPSSSGGSSVGGSLAMQSSSPLPPYTPSSKDVHGSGGTTLTQSAIDELNTPIAAMKGKCASLSPIGKSLCPKTSKHKLLFVFLVKSNVVDKIQGMVDAPLNTANVITTEVIATTMETGVIEPPKNKRVAAAAAKTIAPKKLK